MTQKPCRESENEKKACRSGEVPGEARRGEKESLCETIWNFTRERLTLRYPLFAPALWRYGFAAQPGMTGIGTDGETVYYDPDYVFGRFRGGGESLEHDFLHLFYHCLFLHPVRTAGEDLRLWNLACDMAAQRLIDGGKGEARPEVLYEELARMQRTEDEWEELARRYRVDDHAFWKRADGQRLAAQAEKLWDALQGTVGCGKAGSANGRGGAAGKAQEELALQKQGTYDFKSFLRKFAVAREEVKTDTESFDYIFYLYGLAYYGNMPLIEHLEYQEVHRLEELVIAIDTSGSCKTETVRRFMEETYGILRDRENFFRKMNVYILQCDFCIQDAVHITCEQEWRAYLEHLTVKGRSGTDFRPVFSYVEELRREGKLKNLKGLLYFTDGDGIYPQRPTDYETAFVMYHEKSGHQQVPPWAVKLELDEGFDEY